MQQMKDMIENNISDRERLGLVINTLAHLGRPDENLAEVAHDARRDRLQHVAALLVRERDRRLDADDRHLAGC